MRTDDPRTIGAMVAERIGLKSEVEKKIECRFGDKWSRSADYAALNESRGLFCAIYLVNKTNSGSPYPIFIFRAGGYGVIMVQWFFQICFVSDVVHSSFSRGASSHRSRNSVR